MHAARIGNHLSIRNILPGHAEGYQILPAKRTVRANPVYPVKRHLSVQLAIPLTTAFGICGALIAHHMGDAMKHAIEQWRIGPLHEAVREHDLRSRRSQPPQQARLKRDSDAGIGKRSVVMLSSAAPQLPGHTDRAFAQNLPQFSLTTFRNDFAVVDHRQLMPA